MIAATRASGGTMQPNGASRFRTETTPPVIVESSIRVVSSEENGGEYDDREGSTRTRSTDASWVDGAGHFGPMSMSEPPTRDIAAGDGTTASMTATTPSNSTSPSQGTSSDTTQHHFDEDDDELIEVVEPTWKAVPLRPRKMTRFERGEERRRQMTEEEWLLREKRRNRTTLALILGVVGTVVIGTVIVCAIFVAQKRRSGG